MAKKVTAKQIADLCGVSPSTVSRVLNNTASISEETKNRIFATAAQLGFELNPGSTNLYPTIGIIHPHTNIYLMNEIEQELEKSISALGYLPVFASYRIDRNKNNPEDHDKLVSQFVRSGVSGIFIFTEDLSQFHISDISVPVVFFNLEYAYTQEDCCCVSYDMGVGARLAAEELLIKGCKDPIILLNSHYSPHENGRYTLFIQKFKEAGISIDEDHVVPAERTSSSFEEARNAIRYLSARGISYDSIFAGSDWRAFGALAALREMGVSVPEQIKVIGYDGSEIAQYNYQPITSVVCDPHVAASQLVNLMKSCLENEEIQKRSVIVPVKVFQGKTV
ncbi:MAG: LacI family DNA-binding transcriptional regulator [Erysipelotrichaceae bacterium]|nr:LacI family DNA-binding transcriptional regulator [Erysipelotrichaceae bacterium]